VRHGPTHEKAFCGWRDVPADLTDTAISSDLKRAIATADAISVGRQRLTHDPGLRELNFGDWDGRSFDEIAKTYPTLSRQYWENPGDVAPPKGESWNDASARIDASVTRLLAQSLEQDIIIVAHLGAILTHLQRASGVSAYEMLAQKIDNLSVSQSIWDGRSWQVGPINHIY